MELELFVAKKRTEQERRKLIETVAQFDASQNYADFGYDYFDNSDLKRGYGGYQYDGRYAPIAEKMYDYYNLSEGDTVLELGCAKGFLLYEFLKLGISVTGIDRSNYALENAHPDVKAFIQLGDASTAVYPVSVNLAVAKEVLSHMPINDVRLTITKMREIANNRFYMVSTVAEHHTDAGVMRSWDPTFITNLTMNEWRNLFAELDPEADYQFSVIV